MSGDSSQEKTEKPTHKKIEDARKKGQVAHSKELVNTSIYLGVFLFFIAFGYRYIDSMMALIALPGNFTKGDFNDSLGIVINLILNEGISLIAYVVGFTLLVSLAASFLHVGPVFSAESIIPKLEKIDPMKGFKRIFSMKSLFEFFKSVIKVIILVIVVYFVFKDFFADFLKLPHCGVSCILPLASKVMMYLFFFTGILFVALSGLDYWLQKFFHLKELRMTKDEQKREYKESQGNPEIKGKRKSLHRELAMGGGGSNAQRTKKSSVVITNPTHLAIGIYYERGKVKAPIVMVKGADDEATKIRQYAQEHNVPIAQNVYLARRLFSESELDGEIPSDLYRTTAEILKWVAKIE
jgi:type III secretion protein U